MASSLGGASETLPAGPPAAVTHDANYRISFWQPEWGSGGREFKSRRPDHVSHLALLHLGCAFADDSNAARLDGLGRAAVPRLRPRRAPVRAPHHRGHAARGSARRVREPARPDPAPRRAGGGGPGLRRPPPPRP